MRRNRFSGSRNLFVPMTVVMLCLVWASILFVAKMTLKGPGPTEQAGKADPNYFTPGQLPEQTLPEKTHQGGWDLLSKGWVPPLQRGLTAEQATSIEEIGTNPKVPGFDRREIFAKPSEVISLTLRNNSDPALGYQHNWVLVSPGTAGEVLTAANRAGLQREWRPATDNVLAATHLVGPGDSDTVIFRAPDQPGRYPYGCTFPGHGNAMRGELVVK